MLQRIAPFRHAASHAKKGSLSVISQLPCRPEERLERMEALGKQIAGHILFMCGPDTTNGSSAEAKEKALEVFYRQMLVVERDLGHIRETFQLE
jgi:hypothetical protein